MLRHTNTKSVTHLSSSCMTPEFLVWKVRGSLFLFSTACWYYGAIPLTSRSFTKWSDWQKCAATGFSVFLVLMLKQWPFIRTWRAFSVSPTYCSQHLLHEIRCTRFLLLQVISALMYCLPVVLLLNLLHVTISWQHLHQLLLHLVFMAFVGGAGGFSFARTIKSLIGASLSKSHTSGTALQDACVCLSVCLSVCVRPYTENLNWTNWNEGTRAFQPCTCAKAFNISSVQWRTPCCVTQR